MWYDTFTDHPTDWLLVLFNGLLVVATVLLFLSTRKSVRVAERALLAAHRPWVGPKTVFSEQLAAGHIIKAYVEIKNTGGSPALKMRAAFRGDFLPTDTAPSLPNSSQAPDKALFPDTPDYYYPFGRSRVMSKADFDGILSGQTVAWIIGRVDYFDGVGRLHTTNIRTRWDQSQGAFVPDEHGNDAD